VPERPRTYKTEGVILRRRNLGEADTIFTVFSPSAGKFDGVARGVRKARSHMRGHLEPLTRSNVMLARGRSLDVFTQAETVDPYRALHEDLGRSALAIYCCELIDRFASENIEQADVYWLLVDALSALDNGAAPQVARYFELRLLALTGYALQLSVCALCDARLPEAETLFSAQAGGLVCLDCRAKAGSGRIISVRAVKVLRFASGASIEKFAGLRLDDDLAGEIEHILGDAVRLVLDRDLSTTRYVDHIHRLGPPPGARETAGRETLRNSAQS
jgi:DNA repair protein RecO (recombination protein O)